MRNIKQCYNCKQKFRVEELISYATPNSKTFHNYCAKCLHEKQERDKFSEKVCTLFGIKSPGPRIWTERQRLMNKYGYTDNIIIDSLDYIYNIKHKKVLAESLCLITPELVNDMSNYQRKKEKESLQFAAATQMKTVEYVAPIKENNNTKNQKIYDPDIWLEDGDDN